MRLVLDTNVLLSGLMYPQSTPGRIVSVWREGRFDLIMSREQLTEIARVLGYRKIRRVLRWDRNAIERFLKQLYLRSVMVDVSAVQVTVPGDPDDNVILAGLIAAKADWLITGDSDLLALRERYNILTPGEFIERL
ncbi:MAG: putative toxin-antitoxin system toxin component, PIN family [Gammaproteobacteria bacterium]